MIRVDLDERASLRGPGKTLGIYDDWNTAGLGGVGSTETVRCGTLDPILRPV
jgi:hypothetical protein